MARQLSNAIRETLRRIAAGKGKESVYAVGAAGFWLSRYFRQAEMPLNECDNALEVWEQPL